MPRTRRLATALLISALAISQTGCLSSILSQVGPLGLFMLVHGAVPKTNKAPGKKKVTRFEDKSDVAFSGSIGGLTGTYSVDVGNYGTLEGTADIKGQKKAKVRADGDAELHSLIEAAVLDRLGVDIDVHLATVKYDGKQTTGGVKKKYNLRIKFEGTVLSGDLAGNTLKGKLKAKGKFE
jgi:hypothetical protein